VPIQYSKQRWLELQKILDIVIDTPTDRQTEKLRALCSNDQALYDDIKTMLAGEASAPAMLDHPALDAVAKFTASSQPEDTSRFIDRTGSSVNSFRLCERLGAGGMGVVYRAERDQGGFEQQVAIKFLTHWQDRPAQRERFHQEQQLLADLDHPNIARLYDGGIAHDGQPYLVMEYVSGVPIDHFCHQQRLDLPSVLKLVGQVATALAYAHNRLIVHRDIKPSNILVNESGDVKLLDFGVAKLLGEVDPNLTRTDEQIMTPGFAAPEQLQNQAITVATDVYQLGLVTYALLTLHRPYGDKANSMRDLVKLVCDEEPTLPSTVVLLASTAKDKTTRPSLSEREKLERHRELRGEIDAIILKMVQPDLNRRYHSMSAVQADLCAFFEHRPIAALSGNAWYLFTKSVRRYRKPLAVATAFFGLLVAYAFTVSMQARKIQTALDISTAERKKAQTTAGFMVDMFKAADPNVSGIETVTAQQLLERGEAKVIEDLSETPILQGHMLTSIGEIYYSQGNAKKSVALLELALEKQRLAAPPDQIGLANALTQLAIVYGDTNRYEQAESYYLEALTLYHKTQPKRELENSLAYAELNNAYGLLKIKLGNLDDAERLIKNALSAMTNAEHTQHEEYAVAQNNLANLRITQGQLEAASKHMQKAIRIHEKNLGEGHSYFSIYLINFGNLLTKLERYAEAKPIFERALKLQKSVLGNQHPYVSHTLRNLGVLAHAMGDSEQAETYLNDSLLIRKQNYTVPTLATATVHLQLADVLLDQQRYDEAEAHLSHMRSIHVALEAGNPVVGLGLCSLARLSLLKGDLPAAERHYGQAMELLSSAKLRKSIAQLGFARTLMSLDKYDMALPYAQQALRVRKAELPENHGQIIEAEAIIGLSLAGQGDYESAVKVLTPLQIKLAQKPLHQYGKQHSLENKVKRTLAKIEQDQ